MIRWLANRPRMGAKRGHGGGTIRPERMTRLQQLKCCDHMLPVPKVEGEVRLHRIIHGRYGGNEQRKQPEGACQTGKSQAFPWQA